MKVEYFSTGLLITLFALLAWLSVYAVYKLFQGQR
jgi:hypothetical protein